MRRKNIKYGMAAACIGGGMGITIIVENEEIVNDHLSSSE
jgi:acetyl-CoA acetyltransferase